MCRVSKYGNVSKERSWKALRLWDSPFGCAASEGGAPFVARRAVNLHGCVPASLCPLFFQLRGYPRERISYGSGAPPLLRRLRRTLLFRAPQVVRCGVPRGAHFIRERGAPSVPSSRYVTVSRKRSIRGRMGEGRFCDGF